MNTLNEDEIRQLPPHPLGVCQNMRLVIEDFQDWWAGMEHKAGESYCVNLVGSENVFGKAVCEGDIIHRNGVTYYQCAYNYTEFPITLQSPTEKET